VNFTTFTTWCPLRQPASAVVWSAVGCRNLIFWAFPHNRRQ